MEISGILRNAGCLRNLAMVAWGLCHPAASRMLPRNWGLNEGAAWVDMAMKAAG